MTYDIERGGMSYMRPGKVKEVGLDIVADIVGSFFIAVGVYNFAVASGFPVAGISGIAIIFYHFFGIPIGVMTAVLNIPIIIICYKLLGKTFLLKSLKTMVISTIFMDVVAPMFPVYEGDLMLSCICMGIFSGLGYALIYLRDSSTGGADFVIMAIRVLRPHLSLGKIIIVLDFAIVLTSGVLIGGNVDKIIYGMDAGKLTLIVTEHGQEVADKIDELTQRGSTLLKGVGSYSKEEKQVVMCACSSKQMHMVQKAVKEVDRAAFLVTMESNEVRGEGFKPH